ncbi:glutamyl aminopeptidase isoform X1 [Podarcis raffonei]|uniref:glutamyl aminopeptidase isoform X1 n=2 Tax=Podarcis raffonei TaxID=65483 RepID=UPI0023294CAD|nr:glutamyl aminopeptidase isoform X1 [Podarcis raffonei]
MQRMDMEDKSSKMYCMKSKHVAIICGVIAAVGLILGLGLGLGLKPQDCSSEENGKVPTASPTSVSTASPTVSPAPGETDPCPAENNESGDWKNFRLPTYVSPIHYDLILKPEMEADLYDGSVTITIQLGSPTRHLWLHLRETKITKMPLLMKSSGQSITLKHCFEYKPQEYVVVEAEEELAPTSGNDAYLLTMMFQGRLNGSLVGFYRTTYVEDGQNKSIAATDHEPTDARKSFPCFDEPNIKATYNISIFHEDTYEALSNMPVEQKRSLGNGWTVTTFQKSVPMSTYLVAWAVHQFKYIEKISDRGIPLRVYAQPQQLHTAEYAATITKEIFDFFEGYFNMSYSLPKLDKIAIPDFGTGAMENWGLITYRETNLLYDPNESAASNKQRVAAVVAHELVHQWFGNIVTMDWWEDLWLNEGFASFFEFLGVNATEGDWQMMDQILIEDLFPVLKEDSLISSHAIVVNVSSPDEITSVFDGISYSKGASILRMLEDWISPEKFQAGCQKYLKDHEFKNAKTSDFWKALGEVSGYPVQEVMDTWTKQMGYPVLNVLPNSMITQQRFLLDPTADPSQPASEFGYRWNIPVKWYEGADTDTIFYNKSNLAGITITRPNNPDPNSFLKVNQDHVGFYRVNYATQAWEDLARIMEANHKQFSLADRAGFLEDAFSLARAGLLNYSYALNLTRYLKNEEEYIPWQRAVVAVSYLRDMLADDNTLYPKFQAYFRELVRPIANQLGWGNDGVHINSLLRVTVLEFACSMGDQETLNNASNLFNEWQQGTTSPDVNLRLLVYRYGMQNSGNEDAWNYMFQKYQNTTLAQEKEKLLYGLASVKNVTLLDRFLKNLTDPNLIKSQDVFTVLRYISYNSYGKTMAWDWVRLNWEYLVSRYTLNDRNLGLLVSRITETFNTDLQLWQMENFFEKYPNAGAGASSRTQSIETVKGNIEWLKRYREEIAAWFPN